MASGGVGLVLLERETGAALFKDLEVFFLCFKGLVRFLSKALVGPGERGSGFVATETTPPSGEILGVSFGPNGFVVSFATLFLGRRGLACWRDEGAGYHILCIVAHHMAVSLKPGGERAEERGRLAHRRSGDGQDGGGGRCGCGKVSALVLPAATKGKEVMDCGGVMVLGLPEVERKGQRGGSRSWGK
ncbi:hypothetical protein Ancab_003895 [Ancistrocladus abbreviatus]